MPTEPDTLEEDRRRQTAEREAMLHEIWMAQAQAVRDMLTNPPPGGLKASTIAAANKFLKDNGGTLARFDEKMRLAEQQHATRRALPFPAGGSQEPIDGPGAAPRPIPPHWDLPFPTEKGGLVRAE